MYTFIFQRCWFSYLGYQIRTIGDNRRMSISVIPLHVVRAQQGNLRGVRLYLRVSVAQKVQWNIIGDHEEKRQDNGS